jgi:hypothetical protein
VPITPSAPARFSTGTGWPQAAASGSAMTRAVMSETPPGV